MNTVKLLKNKWLKTKISPWQCNRNFHWNRQVGMPVFYPLQVLGLLLHYNRVREAHAFPCSRTIAVPMGLLRAPVEVLSWLPMKRGLDQI